MDERLPDPAATTCRHWRPGRTRGLAMALAVSLTTAAPASAGPSAPAPAPTARPASADAARQPDVARLVADQIRMERAGSPTALFSTSLRGAHDGVPRDQDNFAPSVFSAHYDVPDRVIGASRPKLDDGNPDRATATATLRFTNADAPVTSFERGVSLALVRESGRWLIDDVRLVGAETANGQRPTREAWVKRGYLAMAPGAGADPACAGPPPGGAEPGTGPARDGFAPLADVGPHPEDPNRSTIAERFVRAIGATCPFGYRLVDINGDGLSDLVLQLTDRRLGATDAGLRRTVAYVLDTDGKWRALVDGLARDVLTRTGETGEPEVALSGTGGDVTRSWRWDGTTFAPVKGKAR